MIEVIKHGKLRKCTCCKCECVFTFEKEDLEIVFPEKMEFAKAVECPECKERNIVIL